VTEAPSDKYFASLYEELHRLADSQRRHLATDLSIGTTTLLHEAYLNLADRHGLDFPDRAQFLGYAARTMRSIVVDFARRGLAQKRGGGEYEITLTASREAVPAPNDQSSGELQQLSLAIDGLADLQPQLAQLIDLHFFCGYTFAEIAEMRKVSERTVQRDWRKARLLLQHALSEPD
jgi:RNA polymerase sigma factor (TIGR02999 family)